MTLRRSDIAFAILALGLLALAAAVALSLLRAPEHRAAAAQTAQVVQALGLSDPALFTEARYTRHLTQADLFTPFQDAPGALEHFPSGALVPPPPHGFGHAGRILAIRPLQQQEARP